MQNYVNVGVSRALHAVLHSGNRGQGDGGLNNVLRLLPGVSVTLCYQVARAERREAGIWDRGLNLFSTFGMFIRCKVLYRLCSSSRVKMFILLTMAVTDQQYIELPWQMSLNVAQDRPFRILKSN